MHLNDFKIWIKQYIKRGDLLKKTIVLYGLVMGAAAILLGQIPTTIGNEGTFIYFITDEIGKFTIGFFAGIFIEKLSPFGK